VSGLWNEFTGERGFQGLGYVSVCLHFVTALWAEGGGEGRRVQLLDHKFIPEICEIKSCRPSLTGKQTVMLVHLGTCRKQLGVKLMQRKMSVLSCFESGSSDYSEIK